MVERQGEEQAVEEPRMADSVLTADRRSKVAGLFVALGVYVLAQFTTPDPRFNAIVAAVAGIGIRIYIPYQASRAVTDPDAMTITAHPDTGDYHYGAVGLALLFASVGALGVMGVTEQFNTAVLAGAAVGLVSFGALRSILPRG